MHRNILFRDNKDRADQIIPISNFDTNDPEKLWEWLAAYEKKTGGKALAIAHNGNVSNGLMFGTAAVRITPNSKGLSFLTTAIVREVDIGFAGRLANSILHLC